MKEIMARLRRRGQVILAEELKAAAKKKKDEDDEYVVRMYNPPMDKAQKTALFEDLKEKYDLDWVELDHRSVMMTLNDLKVRNDLVKELKSKGFKSMR